MADTFSKAIEEIKENVKGSEEFKNVAKTFAEMQKDDVAFGIYKKFQQANVMLRQKQMSGEEITEEDYKDLENQAKAMQGIDVINKLMEEEQKLGMMMDKINQEISEPIINLYQGK